MKYLLKRNNYEQMDKKKKNFKEVLNEMKQVAESMKSFNEAYIFDDEEPGMGPQPEPQMPMQQQQMQGESEEEVAMHAQEIIQHEPIVGKIRETAIEGLRKYADHPTSNLYTFFKSVFLDSDKLLTDKGSK